MRGERLCSGGKPHGEDHLARLQLGLALGLVPRETVERLERDLAAAGAALRLDHGVERRQRDTEVGRVRCDAALAPAEHGVQAVLAAKGIATAAGLALVAGAGDVIEIGAARALEEVAA